jgi:hypothetical protein
MEGRGFSAPTIFAKNQIKWEFCKSLNQQEFCLTDHKSINSMTRLVNYQFFNGSIRLDYQSGQSIWVSLDENSGRVLTRLKKGTLSSVQHTGIWLGTAPFTGVSYVLHNHYLQGGAHVATYDDYASGQQVYWKQGACTNDWLSVIKKGLYHVIIGKHYNWLDYNCQTFTNAACHNQYKSEDVAKWVGILASVTALFFLGAIAQGSRAS